MKPNDSPMLLGKKIRIMFVCLGNICRSPAAQGIMESLVAVQSLAVNIEVDSAGTASYHIGKLPDSRMIDAAAKRQYQLSSRAKALTKELIWKRELLLAMDRDNFDEIQRIAGGDVPHLRLFSDFLEPSWPRDVPDPYYGGEAGFEYVLDMVEAACPRILKRCLVI